MQALYQGSRNIGLAFLYETDMVKEGIISCCLLPNIQLNLAPLSLHCQKFNVSQNNTGSAVDYCRKGCYSLQKKLCKTTLVQYKTSAHKSKVWLAACLLESKSPNPCYSPADSIHAASADRTTDIFSTWTLFLHMLLSY